jgi:hypothetical protein
MAHFARVENGIVKEVIVAEQEFIDNLVYNKPGKWIQTSYNTRGGVHYDPITGEPSEDQSKALRKNFAIVGGEYDKVADAFYTPKPNQYGSWTLDETTYIWNPPVDYPEDFNGRNYNWNEETQSWDAVETE